MACSFNQQTQSNLSDQNSNIMGFEERITWQPYSKRIDPYSIPSDAYSDLAGAFNGSDAMIEFQKKMTSTNPIYSHIEYLNNKQSVDKVSDINASLAKLSDLGPSPSDQIDMHTLHEINNSLYTKNPSYPDSYPLDRTESYDPENLGSTLLDSGNTANHEGTYISDDMHNYHNQYNHNYLPTYLSTNGSYSSLIKKFLIGILIALGLWLIYNYFFNGKTRSHSSGMNYDTPSRGKYGQYDKVFSKKSFRISN